MNRTAAILGFVLCFMGGALAMWGGPLGGPRAKIVNPASWDDTESSVPVSSEDAYWGSRSAPVTIVLFSDYQCPYCVVLEDTIVALKREYGPHQLRIVFKHAPLVHPKARVGHEAAVRAYFLGGSDPFWTFHERAFANGKELTPENFEAWAKEAGLDIAAFNDAELVKRASDKVGSDLAMARQLGVRGTPTSFVNGIRVRGSADISEFRKHIDAELEAARALAKSGTLADRIYVERSTVNRPKKLDPVEPKEARDGTSKDDGEDRATKKKDDDTAAFAVAVGESPRRGPKDALVTIVQYGNFECRFSSQTKSTIDQVLAAHKDTVRLVWKHRPLPYLRRGTPASIVAEIARAEKGEDGFWAAHDALFAAEQEAHQAKRKDAFSDAGLVEIATKLGLDTDKVRAAVADAEPSTSRFDPTPAARPYLDAIEADADGADDLEAEATPHFFINGRRLVGAQSAERFEKVIAEELTKAEALVAKGVARDAVYDEIMKSAKSADLPPTKLIDAAPAGAPWQGAERAKVELHVFSDFECPFCKQVTTTVAAVKDAYGAEIKLVWRDLPQDKHETGKIAAVAAREVLRQKGNDAFWTFHDGLFKLAKTPEFSRAGFEKLAESQGVDVAALRSALDGDAHRAGIERDVASANAAEFGGTPSFVVTYAKRDGKLEGFFQSGAVTPSKLRRLVKLAIGIANGERPAPSASPSQ